MSEKLSALIGIAVLAATGFAIYRISAWMYGSLHAVDPTVGAALIAGGATVVSSVFIASYNSRKAKERVVFEAHREKKAEIYTEFMDMIVQIMRNSRAGREGGDVLPEDVEEFFYSFTSRVAVYGGPGVVKAYGEWRSAYKSDGDPDDSAQGLFIMDKLFREMRGDLGESNRSIQKNELPSSTLALKKRRVFAPCTQ